MKPHALRRGLWLANLALGAAVIGLGAWFALKVKPAVASVVDRPANKRPKDLEALRADYEKMRVSGLKWKPKPPVDDDELYATILRADYKKKDPTYWVFSGPLPPEDVKQAKPVDTGPPPPEGLDVLGKVSTVIVDPPHSTILFKFKGGKSRAFRVGDFVLQSDNEDKRFRIKQILEPKPAVYEIHYAVFGKDKDKPERSAVLRYDRSGDGAAYPDFLRPDAPKKPIAAKGTTDGTSVPAAGTGDGSGAGAGDGTAEGTAEGTGDGTATPEEGAAEGDTSPKVVSTRKATADLTIEDLAPKILENPRNRNQKAIVFDDNSYRYFKGKQAGSIAKTVKTAVAKDKATGKVIGLRITGFAKDAPADVFDVRKGDILVSINGQKITSRAEAVSIAQSLKNANLVTVVIDRRGKLVTYRVDPQDPKNRRKVRYFEGFSH